MNRISRRVSAAVNPVATATTRWFRHSALRHVLTGTGPTAQQRQFIRDGRRDPAFGPSAEEMKARAAAIDELLSRDDHDM